MAHRYVCHLCVFGKELPLGGRRPQPSFRRFGVAKDVVVVRLDVGGRHDERRRKNVSALLELEGFGPVSRNVAALDDEASSVFDCGPHHFPHDRPEFFGELVVVIGRERCLAAADETHLEEVEREDGNAVALHEAVGEKRLAGMRGAGEKKDAGCVRNHGKMFA